VRSDANSAAQPGKTPVIEVALKGGMWWSIPRETSQALYDKHLRGEDAAYTWDWGKSRAGSYVQDDQETSINRYEIDFNALEQRNIDNGRRRSIRIAWVDHVSVWPKWTGQTPQE